VIDHEALHYYLDWLGADMDSDHDCIAWTHTGEVHRALVDAGF